MGKRRKTNQGKGFVILLFILSLAGTGCGDSRQADNTEQMNGTKVGAMSYGYFFEEDGIVISSGERFLYSDWEPVEFDYICMDPTCSHLIGSCGARTIQDEKSALRDFCLVYQDRLIILHAYCQYVDNDASEGVWDTSNMYQTDIYEANLDGSNRRKMATFSGTIDVPSIPYATVLVDGKLYFGGPTEVRNRIDPNSPDGEQKFITWTSAAVYCLDLIDYTLETFMVMEDREGEPTYLYQIYEYDGMIYWILNYIQEDSAVLYRSDPGVGGCEEIMRFDSDAVRFWGAIGNTVYYTYENSWKTLYARDISAEATEREIMTVTGEDMIVIPFVIDGQILCMTDSRFEGENRMAEYTVFDPSGNVLDTIRYNEYITFLDVVGDKIIYYKYKPDSDWEVWWADKEDIKDLLKKGVKIGPLSGSRLDTLAD